MGIESLEKLAVEQPREVDAGRIERELRQMWSQAEASVMRTSSLNIVAVCWQCGALDEMAEVLARIGGAHPARMILGSADPASGDELRAWVSLVCHRATGGSRVCHELVRLSVNGREVRHIDNAVLSILTPDLPRFLWWHGPLPEGAVVERAFGTLAEACERLVVDTRYLADPLMEMVAMAELSSLGEKRAALGDLNWHRLTSWRQVLAQCFDPPDVRPMLERVDRVELSYDCRPSRVIPVQVLLLLGWLASRLQWRPVDVHRADGGMFDLAFEKDGRRISVHLACARKGPDTRSRLRSIAVEGAGSRVLVRALDDKGMESRIELPGRPPLSRVVSTPPLDLSTVLDAELRILGRNPVFEESLRAAEILSSLSLRAGAASAA